MDEKEVQRILIEIIYATLNEVEDNDSITQKITPDILISLYRLAKNHDLAHIVSNFVYRAKIDVDQKLQTTLRQEEILSVYRHERMKYAFGELCAAFDEAGIAYIPLKGSVIRHLYPQPWMRTSSDVDILIREEHLEAAVSHLKTNLNYTEQCRSSHDISLFSPEGVHIELHYTLIEDSVSPSAASVLANVWDVAVPCAEGQQRLRLPDEYLYFYHVAHMAKHFDNGGCGIRPFMDMWLLDRQVSDSSQRDALLERGGLLKFAAAARRLSRVWLDGDEHNGLSQRLEHYILHGGVYGTSRNRIAIQLHRQGGRIRYALRKIFLSYDQLKLHYPILQKHKWLTPAMEVRRWCKLIFCGHIRRSLRELRFVGSISNRRAHDIEDFRRQLGLVEK